MKFFSYESRFSQLVLKICYACCLNLLWLICSLPIVTIGASTTALYYASLKIIRDEEGNLAAKFFRSFRENFRQATVLWLILLGLGLFLGGDIYVVWHLRAGAHGSLAVLWTLCLALLIGACVVYVIVLEFVFPLLASVSNTNLAMLKNSFLIGTHYLFATILVFAVHFAMFYVVVAVFTPMLVFGEGLCALISAWLLNNILISVSGTPEDRISVSDTQEDSNSAPETSEEKEDT